MYISGALTLFSFLVASSCCRLPNIFFCSCSNDCLYFFFKLIIVKLLPAKDIVLDEIFKIEVYNLILTLKTYNRILRLEICCLVLGKYKTKKFDTRTLLTMY